MNCVVTAGPTYEPLDGVRRLTNMSTGRLGTELANYLAEHGHEVTLLIGLQATDRTEHKVRRGETFTTTEDLSGRLQAMAGQGVDAIFHAAAVSDFAFGRIYARSAGGKLTVVKSGKLSTRDGTLLAELVPTAKIIASLRKWHPRALLVGWKYEVVGKRAAAVALGERQLAECRTDACVVNGRAYGRGFGLVRGAGECVHLAEPGKLYAALAGLVGGHT